uniref:MyTH4 domain-containing protein n=1 Tax=Cairina moschata TaxID=8855 RepID=A0A8C3GNP5_CAIMO
LSIFSFPTDIAKICQSNLRKNFMYGGRRHLPFPVELEAFMSNCSGTELGLPGHSTYLLFSSLQVVKELMQEICEQLGAGEPEEMQEFALFAIRSKMVRPMRTEEYLHDYLLEDALVTVSLRRLTWKTPLHFENKIYTDVHYGQVSNKGTVSTRNLSRGELLSTFWHREGLKEYIPMPLQSQINPQTLQNHLGMLLRTRQPLQPLDAKIQFIEHVMKLPFFGYNFYFVERVSNKSDHFALKGLHQVMLCGLFFPQAVSHVIPLKELQKMRTLRPTSDGGLPGIELNYGSAASPKSLWLELPEAKEMYHTVVVILDKTDFHP